MDALPNLHPALVHFPIALVFAAFGIDLAALAWRRAVWLDRAAATLYGLAAAGAIAAYTAGDAAEDSLGRLSAAAQEAVAEHADLGLWTMVLFLALAAARSWLAWRERDAARVRVNVLRLVLLGAGVGACALVFETAEHGGALVYRHGLAVPGGPGGAPRLAAEGAPPIAAKTTSNDLAARLHRAADGSVHWMPLSEDGAALGTILRPAAGSDANAVKPGPAVAGAAGLTLAVDGRAILVLEGPHGDVEVGAEIDRAGFQGTIGVVHHLTDTASYGVFAVSSAGRAELRLWRAGKESLLDGASVRVEEDPLRLSVSSAGRHLKGVVGEAVVAHGHAEPGPPGACGLLLDGRGTVRIRELMVMPLQKEPAR